MKKILQCFFVLSLSIIIPGSLTMIIMGNTAGEEKNMGISVTMKNKEMIDGEQFVIGMAAAELSYVKEEEAQKAWMIVCRTNFLKAAGNEKEVKEENLALDYISPEELEQNNGRKAYLELHRQLEEASEETFGQALFYGDTYIDALYHQVSVGKTVSSKEIYSVDVPYLISVDSSQDVEAEEYMEVKILSYKECAKKLKENGYKETEDSCKNQLKIEKQTTNGFVENVTTDSNKWSGEEWKNIFELNSINFYLEDYGNQLRIVSLGKGHDMGMSLYGANVLAEKDLSAKMILSYYYPGTELRKISEQNKKLSSK